MFPVTQRWESHAAVFSHMFPPQLQCVPVLKQTLAGFWTPIDVLPENNSPKSVLIPKVVTFGTFKINFPFLHSVWVTKPVHSGRRRQRQAVVVRMGHSDFLRFTNGTKNCANSLCASVGVIVYDSASVPLRVLLCALVWVCIQIHMLAMLSQISSVLCSLAEFVEKCVQRTLKREVVYTHTVSYCLLCMAWISARVWKHAIWNHIAPRRFSFDNFNTSLSTGPPLWSRLFQQLAHWMDYIKDIHGSLRMNHNDSG